MIYEHLIIIKGYILTTNEVMDFIMFVVKIIDKHKNISLNLLKTDLPIDSIWNNKKWLINNLININNLLLQFHNIQIYIPQCHSIAINHLFIIGTCVKKYKRIITKCYRCDENSACGYCIGLTENGYYDVRKIFNNIIEVDKNHICKWCHNDNRKIKKSCKLCKFSKEGLKLCLEKKNRIFDILIGEWFTNKNLTKEHIKYYYLLDGCLFGK